MPSDVIRGCLLGLCLGIVVALCSIVTVLYIVAWHVVAFSLACDKLDIVTNGERFGARDTFVAASDKAAYTSSVSLARRQLRDRNTATVANPLYRNTIELNSLVAGNNPPQTRPPRSMYPKNDNDDDGSSVSSLKAVALNDRIYSDVKFASNTLRGIPIANYNYLFT